MLKITGAGFRPYGVQNAVPRFPPSQRAVGIIILLYGNPFRGSRIFQAAYIRTSIRTRAKEAAIVPNRLFIITGVGGHVGNNIARLLLERGEQVRGLARENEDVTMLYGTGVSIVRGDVRRPETMEPLFYGVAPDTDVILIHTAGLINIGSYHLKQVEEVNVGGTRNVIALCREHSVKKLVYISSVPVSYTHLTLPTICSV